MNLITRKHAQDLISTFEKEGTLPLGCKRPLPAEAATDQIDTYTKMFDVYRSVDNTQIDEYPGLGKIVMTADPPDKPQMQWVLDYQGTPKNGSLSESYEMSGSGCIPFQEHTYVRYQAGSIDVLNLHVEDKTVMAQALQLDRHAPGASTVLLYQWPGDALPRPDGLAIPTTP